MSIILSVLTVATLVGVPNASAQKYLCKNAHIWFYSHTPFEDIEAHNNNVATYLDTQSGDVVFQLLNKSFKFKRALMEEHFNENYMESDKYPKSEFKAKITNLEDIDFSKKGSYKAVVEGALTIHNKTRTVKVNGVIVVDAASIHVTAKFDVVPQDYGIEIPSTVKDKFAKSMDVSVDAIYAPYEK